MYVYTFTKTIRRGHFLCYSLVDIVGTDSSRPCSGINMPTGRDESVPTTFLFIQSYPIVEEKNAYAKKDGYNNHEREETTISRQNVSLDLQCCRSVYRYLYRWSRHYGESITTLGT